MKLRIMRLLAIVTPDKWSDELADADFEEGLRNNDALRTAAPSDRERKRVQLREATWVVYRQLRSTLAWSLLLVLSAAICGWLVDVAVRIFGQWFNAASLVFGSLSIVVLSWATLGRLQWESWKRQTSPELADQDILWLLYWLGTCAGIIAFLSSR
jgi:hypothetical protein